jgi:adenosylcobinamide kinase/adenosylcobinamide-phosphate guanylyltransferase
MRELILGGARSGKSALAERLAQDSGLPVTYLASTQALDEEMRARIEQHRRPRPAHWHLVEEPLALGEALAIHAGDDRCLLVDCLTLWLTNVLLAGEGTFSCERRSLLRILPTLSSRVILVSNEVGLGVVPMDSLSRRFVDEAGRLNQAVAGLCDRIVFTASGLPPILKGDPL